jgi:hypothetical protein
MENQLVHHAAKHAAQAVKELKPLGDVKNPFLAGVLGMAFGPIGPAVYFRSVKDFFICTAMLAGLSFLVPFGPGEVTGWAFSAAYAVWRAKCSNEKLLSPPVLEG